jgi:hypothetical protein
MDRRLSNFEPKIATLVSRQISNRSICDDQVSNFGKRCSLLEMISQRKQVKLDMKCARKYTLLI